MRWARAVGSSRSTLIQSWQGRLLDSSQSALVLAVGAEAVQDQVDVAPARVALERFQVFQADRLGSDGRDHCGALRGPVSPRC
jgi:hypothetical protein